MTINLSTVEQGSPCSLPPYSGVINTIHSGDCLDVMYWLWRQGVQVAFGREMKYTCSINNDAVRGVPTPNGSNLM